MINLSTEKTQTCCSDNRFQKQQAAISRKEIVFRFRKDVQSEKGWCLMSCA